MNDYRYIDENRNHLHTLRGKPLFGTSSVVGILSKPLIWWAVGKALEPLGWKNGKKHTREEKQAAALEGLLKLKEMDEKKYCNLLDACYYAHDTSKKDAAETGTILHEELGTYIRNCLDYGGKPLGQEFTGTKQVKDFATWAQQNVDMFLFSEGHTYSEMYWLGGISDAGALMKDGKKAIMDFKSSKDAYYSHFVQVAGYSIQIEENGIFDKNGNRILNPFMSNEMIVIPFGSKKFIVERRQNVNAFQDAFLGALANYKLQQIFEDVKSQII